MMDEAHAIRLELLRQLRQIRFDDVRLSMHERVEAEDQQFQMRNG